MVNGPDDVYVEREGRIERVHKGSPPRCPSGLEKNLFTLTMTGLALFGWAWADPATALIVAFAAAREGRENIREAAELADDAEDRGER